VPLIDDQESRTGFSIAAAPVGGAKTRGAAPELIAAGPPILVKESKASQGSGEIPTPATIAAVANAFFDATGVRMREAPMTPGRVRAALKAAGVA
jgi:nicotinate dehydrogenase subunit B